MASADTLSRREILKRAAMALGVTALSPAIATAVMAAADTEPAEKPRYLSAAQMRLVAQLTEMIIPATDTPGANAAGVHHYIDALLADYFSAPHRKQFMAGLAAVDQRAIAQGQKGFADADEPAQIALMTQMDEEAYGDDAERHPFFRELKELTLVGYYTSQIGATVELSFQPVPGHYRGCVPYQELGRAWATS